MYRKTLTFTIRTVTMQLFSFKTNVAFLYHSDLDSSRVNVTHWATDTPTPILSVEAGDSAPFQVGSNLQVYRRQRREMCLSHGIGFSDTTDRMP